MSDHPVLFTSWPKYLPGLEYTSIGPVRAESVYIAKEVTVILAFALTKNMEPKLPNSFSSVLRSRGSHEG